MARVPKKTERPQSFRKRCVHGNYVATFWPHFAICVASDTQNQVTDLLAEDSAPGPRLQNVVATVFAETTVLLAPDATHLVQLALSPPFAPPTSGVGDHQLSKDERPLSFRKRARQLPSDPPWLHFAISVAVVTQIK